jgi:hypothetical protein
MGARRKLRHDAAESLMHGMLGRHDIRHHSPVRSDDGGGGLIAGGFDAEDCTN